MTNFLQIAERFSLIVIDHVRRFRIRSHSIYTCSTDEIVYATRDLLRKSGNWEDLTNSFDSINLNESIIEKVLLELNQPEDAKRALSFFHWSARRSKTKHEPRSYCIAVHILVRARLITDARALLESAIRNSVESGSSSGFDVLEHLLGTYHNSFSSPFVFDLLIQTYSRLRLACTAFDACRYLEEQGLGFSCSIITLNTLLHVVQKSDDCSLAWNIYEFMIQSRTYPNEISIRIMTSVLCKEGKLNKSVELLDRIHGKRCSPMVIVNTYLIFGLLEKGRIDDGVVLLKRMLQKNMILDDVAYSMIVYAKVRNKSMESAQEVFGEMLKRGFQANAFIYTLFIGGHCDEGKIDEANLLFQEMENMGLKPYDETFNFLIEGCVKAGKLEESLTFCEEMVKLGFLPSCSTYNVMVRKLSNIKDVKRANAVLTVLLDKGFVPNEVTYSYLMNVYGKNGEIQEVLKLYYEMEFKGYSLGSMTYLSLVRSLCECGNLKEAEKFLKVMKDRSVTPTRYIYMTLIINNFERGDMERVIHVYNEMKKQELTPCCEAFAEMLERIQGANAA